MNPQNSFSVRNIRMIRAFSLAIGTVFTLSISPLSAATAIYATGTFSSNTVLDLVGVPPASTIGMGFAGADITTDNGFLFVDYLTPPTQFTYSGGGPYNGFAVSTTGDFNFDSLLSSASTTSGTSLAINNLSIGASYTVLFLYADDRDGIGERPRLATVSDGTGSITATNDWVNPGGVPAVGTYITATFVADGNTQAFTLGGPGGPQLNAVAMSVPEPSAIALVAGAGLVAFLFRRRLRASGI